MPAAAKTDFEDLARKTRFVFRGTVQKLKAANIPEVQDTSETAIIHVDEIIQAPPALSHYTGRDITVALIDPTGVTAGAQFVFFTNAWLFGNEGVAVRSMAHHPPEAQVMALHAPDKDPVANLEDRDTQAHYDDADLVVSGRVTQVRLPKDASSISTREHDPDWREAVVNVEQVHKGKTKSKQIVVRFPASQDRQWHGAPKLLAGQRGHFMLHDYEPGPVETGKKAAARAAAPADTYVAMHHLDFEPEEHPSRVARLLARMAAPKPRK
jgi:hypothetical protein